MPARRHRRWVHCFCFRIRAMARSAQTPSMDITAASNAAAVAQLTLAKSLFLNQFCGVACKQAQAVRIKRRQLRWLLPSVFQWIDEQSQQVSAVDMTTLPHRPCLVEELHGD